MNSESTLSKPWRNFLLKLQDFQILKIHQWKDVHFLGYFLDRYEKHYGRKFALTYQGPPGKCPEIVFIKKMMAMLGDITLKGTKEYIDWVFDFKIIPNNMQIRTVTFLMTPGLGNEYHFFMTKRDKIDRTTSLTSECQNVANELGIEISTYGDLAFAQSALTEAPEHQSNIAIKEMFHRLACLGFDVKILQDLK